MMNQDSVTLYDNKIIKNKETNYNWNLDFKKISNKIQKIQNFFKTTITVILPLTISSVWISFIQALWKETKSQTDFLASYNTWTFSLSYSETDLRDTR